MSPNRPADKDRLIDLLIENATTGISSTDEQEFYELISSPDNQQEAERFELTAAALNLSYVGDRADQMPRELQDRILVEAGAFFTSPSNRPASQPKPGGSVELLSVPRSKANRFTWREAVALAVTAACIALLLTGYNPFASPVGTAVAAKTPSQQLDSLIASAPDDLVRVSWVPKDSTAGGKVVWSDSRQKGYMILNGLAVNDPTKEQYQLWIFDVSRDSRHPVDGGVFDVSSTDEIVVPIDARLPIDEATMFAVTIEKSGGVVVSDRKRMPLAATVDRPTP
jgi:hypothetical protein